MFPDHRSKSGQPIPSAENIYRSGGDEFAAIYLSPDDDAVTAEILACAETGGYAVPLSIATGYASGSIGEDFDSTFQQANRRMYEHKQRIKQDNAELSPFR